MKNTKKKYFKGTLTRASDNTVISEIKVELNDLGEIDLDKLPKSLFKDLPKIPLDNVPKNNFDLIQNATDSYPKVKGFTTFFSPPSNNTLDLISKNNKMLELGQMAKSFSDARKILELNNIGFGNIRGFDDARKIYDFAEKFQFLQKTFDIEEFEKTKLFLKNKVNPKVKDIKKIVASFRIQFEEKVKFSPEENSFADWIFSKYYYSLRDLVELSKDEILIEIKLYCDEEIGRFDKVVNPKSTKQDLENPTSPYPPKKSKKEELLFDDIFISQQAKEKAINTMIDLKMINSEFIYLMGSERTFIRSFIIACKNKGIMRTDINITPQIKALTVKLGLGELRINNDKKHQIVKIETFLIK
jgi:hypothetical protein